MNIKDILLILVDIIAIIDMILLARAHKREYYLLELLDISMRDLCHIKQICDNNDTESEKLNKINGVLSYIQIKNNVK